MATVEVFVDDAVRGHLPHVCAKTGLPADGKLRIAQSRGGVGLAGLLIFLGPIGWIVLLVIAFTAHRETFTVRLPYSEDAVDRERQLGRTRLIAAVVAVSSVVVALWSGHHADGVFVTLLALVAVAAAIVAIVEHVVLCSTRVGVSLDASRRWVTLSRVHPDFVRAVDASEPVVST